MAKHRRGQSGQTQPDNFVNDVETANRIAFKPASPRQRFHAKSLDDNQLTVVLGPAGAGKTLVSMAHAAKGIMLGTYTKIVLMRPAVALEGEEHGFLPGKLHDKVAPWARPMLKKLSTMLGKARLDAMIASGCVEVAPFSYLRGDEFESGTFVMLDEAQNCTVGQLKAFSTRIADGATIVIAGDVSQNDLGTDSGLAVLADVIKGNGIQCGIVEYKIEDIKRGALCKAFVAAWETYEKVG